MGGEKFVTREKENEGIGNERGIDLTMKIYQN